MKQANGSSFRRNSRFGLSLEIPEFHKRFIPSDPDVSNSNNSSMDDVFALLNGTFEENHLNSSVEQFESLENKIYSQYEKEEFYRSTESNFNENGKHYADMNSISSSDTLINEDLMSKPSLSRISQTNKAITSSNSISSLEINHIVNNGLLYAKNRNKICKKVIDYETISNINDNASVSGISFCSAVTTNCYNTPLQRLTEEIKWYKAQIDHRVVELNFIEDNLHQEISDFNQETNNYLEMNRKEYQSLCKEIDRAFELLQIAQIKFSKAKDRNEILARQIQLNKKELVENIEEDKVCLLKMFEKGTQASCFEYKTEELIKTILSDPTCVNLDDLSSLLKNTENELKRWKNLQLTETYKKSFRKSQLVNIKDANLRSLRDAIYYYITENNELLLQVCIKICEFTPVQMKIIRKALEKNKYYI